MPATTRRPAVPGILTPQRQVTTQALILHQALANMARMDHCDLWPTRRIRSFLQSQCPGVVPPTVNKEAGHGPLPQ